MKSAVTWLLNFGLSKFKNVGKDVDTRAWIDMVSFVRKPLDFAFTIIRPFTAIQLA